MTDNGEAYIITLKTQHTIPTLIVRSVVVCCKVKTKTARIATNSVSPAKTAAITNLCFGRPLKTKKMVMNTTSIRMPAPLIVTTSVLSGCTIGSPQRTQTRQFIRVAKYGIGEYSSTDFFFTILLKVGLNVNGTLGIK